MSDKIKQSYQQSKNIYDDVLTQNNWWSRLYNRLFWEGVDDNEIARRTLELIPDDFKGKLLDVPVGTAVFTWRKYQSLKEASITCLDYSEDMLSQAKERFRAAQLKNVKTLWGDVGKLPFEEEAFDIVLSMNGFHAFPEKERAFEEVRRVLKKGGLLVSCFYIRGESKVTDLLVNQVLSKKGWFTPPFDTKESLKKRLEKYYHIEEFHVEGSIVYFSARKPLGSDEKA